MKPGFHIGHNSAHVQYGLSCQEFDDLVRRSEGRCDRCGRHLVFLAIDHDHHIGWGAVRGFVCMKCNSIISYVENGERELDEMTLEYLRNPYHVNLSPREIRPRANRVRTRDHHLRTSKLSQRIDVAEAAEILGVSRNEVDTMATNGRLLGDEYECGERVFRRVLVERIARLRSALIAPT